MNLTFGHSPALLVLSVIAAAAVTWWTYRTTVPDIGAARKWMLGALRFTALALVVFMLFEPLFSRDRTVTEDPVLGLLVDASESMLLADSLVGDAGPASDELLASLSSLSASRSVRAFSFGADISEADDLSSIRFDRNTTNLSDALLQLRDRLADRPLGAVVLLSDGLHNTGANPIHVAERFPAPVIGVVHGDTTARRDIRIVQVLTNEIAYSGTSVPVRVRLRNDGFEPRTVTVSLLSDGDVLENQSVPLPPDGSESTVDFAFEANEPGSRSMSVAVTRLEGEVTWRNNTAGTSIQVLDQKKSILLVAGAPSPDVAALVRLLEADENADLTTRIQSGPGRYLEGGMPADLSEYDLLLLVGYPGQVNDPADSRRLADAVGEGLPVLFVQDRATDLRAVQREWTSHLPVGVRVIRATYTNTAFAPTRESGDHAIFDIEDRRDAAGWTRLPPLSANESRWEVVPGATVLATRRIRGITLDDPLFVVSRRAGQRSAALLAHGFWRWNNVPDDLEPDAARWNQLLQNT
ncbi:MAG: hypothetical protein HKN17_06790, partial [Rhodothermales bacterium]|nr:hypothetical protein [Rhodothermales bacterium]